MTLVGRRRAHCPLPLVRRRHRHDGHRLGTERRRTDTHRRLRLIDRGVRLLALARVGRLPGDLGVKGFALRQFNPPPGWPEPPNVRWRPPKNFKPRRSWPDPPAGWAFWIDEHGTPVRGPIGRFGGPPLLKLGALVATVLTLVGLLLFVPFSGQDSATTLPSTPAPTESTSTTPSSGTTTRLPVGRPFGASPDEVTVTPTERPTDRAGAGEPEDGDSGHGWFPSAQPRRRRPPDAALVGPRHRRRSPRRSRPSSTQSTQPSTAPSSPPTSSAPSRPEPDQAQHAAQYDAEHQPSATEPAPERDAERSASTPTGQSCAERPRRQAKAPPVPRRSGLLGGAGPQRRRYRL